MEIKYQLDATEVFIADLIACSTCFGHHYAHHQELKSIIQWLLPVVFRAVVFKLLVWCGAEGYVSGLQDAVYPLLTSDCFSLQIFPPLFMTATQQPVSLPAQGQSCTAGAIGIATGWGATRVSVRSSCNCRTLNVNQLAYTNACQAF